MDFGDFIDALKSLEREKGIPFESLLHGLEEALAAAYNKTLPEEKGARVILDPTTGEITVFEHDVDEERKSLRDESGNYLNERQIAAKPFGRIEAQTAKQVILQKIREAEREMTLGEYSGRENDIVTGIVQQSDARYTLLDLGKVEALMPQSQQVPGERYDHGTRVKAIITDVRRTAKGPSITVSRTDPGLVKRLFELEVPEIAEGIVEIRAIAREAGHRTKLAVVSSEPGVDPVGACVGGKGSRVRMVVNELRGEKIDIVPWSDDPKAFVANALSPAKVKEVRISEAEKTALVLVPDYQLSLAIGKEGQNARLAARLTGWRVDIKSESQFAEEQKRAAAQAAATTPRPSEEAPPQNEEEPAASRALAEPSAEPSDEPSVEPSAAGAAPPPGLTETPIEAVPLKAAEQEESQTEQADMPAAAEEPLEPAATTPEGIERRAQ